MILVIACLVFLILVLCWGRRGNKKSYRSERSTRRHKLPYFVMDDITYEIDHDEIRRMSDGRIFPGPNVGEDTFSMEGTKYRITQDTVWRINKDIPLNHTPEFKRINGECHILINGKKYPLEETTDIFVMNGLPYQYIRFRNEAWLIAGNDPFRIYK